jgi:hypothetical protein
MARSFILGAVAVSGILSSASIATDASAGAQYSEYGACEPSANGSPGQCYGLPLGFRNDGYSEDFVEFGWDAAGNTAYFYGYYQNNPYSCYVPSGSTLLANWGQAIGATRQYFNISWNAAGTCTGLYLYTMSEYHISW